MTVPKSFFQPTVYSETYLNSLDNLHVRDIIGDDRLALVASSQPLQFANDSVSYTTFKSNYQVSWWVWAQHKVVALPAALIAGVIKTTYHFCLAFFYATRSAPHERPHCKANVYNFVRDVQEALGYITRLFWDARGSYWIEESRFYKEWYRCSAEKVIKMEEDRPIYYPHEAERITLFDLSKMDVRQREEVVCKFRLESKVKITPGFWKSLEELDLPTLRSYNLLDMQRKALSPILFLPLEEFNALTFNKLEQRRDGGSNTGSAVKIEAIKRRIEMQKDLSPLSALPVYPRDIPFVQWAFLNADQLSSCFHCFSNDLRKIVLGLIPNETVIELISIFPLEELNFDQFQDLFYPTTRFAHVSPEKAKKLIYSPICSLAVPLLTWAHKKHIAATFDVQEMSENAQNFLFGLNNREGDREFFALLSNEKAAEIIRHRPKATRIPPLLSDSQRNYMISKGILGR